MKSRSRLIFLLLFLLFGVVLAFFSISYRHSQRNANLPVDNKELTIVSSANVDPVNYRSQYIAERLIRGYIKDYDRETQTLNIRYQVNARTKEQIISYPIASEQTVYCWPQYNNGVDISQAFMPIDPNTQIYIKGEKAVAFGSVIDQLIGKYVFLQTNEQEKLTKLAIIACYE